MGLTLGKLVTLEESGTCAVELLLQAQDASPGPKDAWAAPAAWSKGASRPAGRHPAGLCRVLRCLHPHRGPAGRFRHRRSAGRLRGRPSRTSPQALGAHRGYPCLAPGRPYPASAGEAGHGPLREADIGRDADEHGRGDRSITGVPVRISSAAASDGSARPPRLPLSGPCIPGAPVVASSVRPFQRGTCMARNSPNGSPGRMGSPIPRG